MIFIFQSMLLGGKLSSIEETKFSRFKVSSFIVLSAQLDQIQFEIIVEFYVRCRLAKRAASTLRRTRETLLK